MDVINGHLGDFALLLIGLAYVISLLRDYRPIRALRDENADLRAAFTDLQRKYDDLEGRYKLLEQSRDFHASFEPLTHTIEQARADGTRERAKLLEALEAHEVREERAWAEITRGLAANTAVLGTLAAGINAGTLITPEAA